MEVRRFDLDGLVLITPDRHGDSRGFFSETYQKDRYAAAGIDVDFVQDNHSRSAEAGTLRGMHFQTAPFAQGKLVRVPRGAVLDVVVDIREGSPTYGQHVAVELSDANWSQLWVPAGFAHGALTLVPDTEILYKVTAVYSAAHEGGIAWDDPALGIDWPFAPEQVHLSDRDRKHPKLADLATSFVYQPDGADA